MRFRSRQDLLGASPLPPFVLFWGHRTRADGVITKACFSQWYPAPFTEDGTVYATAEHYMMAAKARLFGDDDALQAVLATTDPKEAKRLGRGVRGFDGARWEAQRYHFVVRGNLLKFGQIEAPRSFLLATGDHVIVEASPYDRVWGIGLAAADPRAVDPARWEGENLLGFALMEVRERLRGG